LYLIKSYEPRRLLTEFCEKDGKGHDLKRYDYLDS